MLKNGQRYSGIDNPPTANSQKTTAVLPFVYINNELAWINTPEGRVVNHHFGIKEAQGDALAAEFHLRDHLGNTRVVLLAEGGQYSVDGFSDYYPFGMQMREEWEMPYKGDLLTNRYLYNGKEMQDDMRLGWYDYGFCFYDPALVRFTTIDPLTRRIIINPVLFMLQTIQLSILTS